MFHFSNYQKYFLFNFSLRRNFIPLLSIFFLTLENTNAAQLGIFMGIAYFVSFALEMPSSYFADRFGHKQTLILSKICQIISLVLFLSAVLFSSPNNFYIFTLGAIFQALGFSFYSGTFSAYFHEILSLENKEQKFGKYMSRLRGKVSLFSIIFIIGFPFLAAVDIKIPFLLSIFIDCIGLLFLLSLPNTKTLYQVENKKSLIQLIKESKQLKILHLSIFLGISAGFLIGENTFRYVYLTELGYPLFLIGMVMGMSRLVWFIVGHYAYLLEKYFTLRQIFFTEILFFPIFLMLIAVIKNPYIVGGIFSLIIGYQHGRKPVIQGIILNNYVTDKNYKSTFLSIESMINSFSSMLVAFLIGFFMKISYSVGYAVLSLSLMICLIFSYSFIFREEKNTD